MTLPRFDAGLGLGLLPSRRAFLGGGATVVGLPLLESLESRIARAAGPISSSVNDIRRFLAFFVPCGFWMDSWTPKGEGATWELSPTQAALAGIKHKLSVLGGLDNLPAREPDGKGDHACGTAGFLTCRPAKKLIEGGYRLGISADQVAARAIGGKSRVGSLQLGVKADSMVCDPGYSCAYINNISWASETQPLPKTTRPDLVFDQIFEGLAPEADSQARDLRRARRTSVLDFVLAQSHDLDGKLGITDRRKLGEYMAGIRDVERKIAAAAPPPAPGCAGVARPTASPDVPERVRVMLDLIVLAFQCDATRVISFMMGNGFEGSFNFPFLGISANHHPISHHQGRAENSDRLKKIDAWEITQLAYLLHKLDAVQEGERTLLDNSVVYFSSEIEDGNSHRHTNLPVIVAGGAGAGLRTGRHLRYPGKSLASLFVSLLQAVGANVSSFGADGTGPLPDLTV
jgi:hypothetical protein